jgi:hypothetical protein
MDMSTPHPTGQPNAVQGFVERRRRARIHSTTQGWLIPETVCDSEAWEVRVQDISRQGVGFESTQKMSPGEECRIRIGRGPMRLARRIKIVNCRAGADGHYVIGGEFVPVV